MDEFPIERADEFLDLLRRRVRDKTYDHCVSVARTMLGMADRAGIRPEQAVTAGLLHDLCKAMKPEELAAAAMEYGITEDNVEALIEALVPEESYLGVLRLGDLVAVSIPGELFSKLGLEIKQGLTSAGAEHPIIVGLGNEWISYMMPPEEFDQGGYEPGVSFLAPEAEAIAKTAAIDLMKEVLQ